MAILERQVTLITGAGSGINQGIARMMAAHGARVVIIGRRQEKLDQTCALIAEHGGEAVATPRMSAMPRRWPRQLGRARKGSAPTPW